MDKMFGWVEWDGGACPVPDGTEVKFQMKEETPAMADATSAAYAEGLRWSHLGSDSDIIAYRVISQPAATPLPVIAADLMVPPLSGEDLIAGAPQVNTPPIPAIAVDSMVPPLSGEDLVAGAPQHQGCVVFLHSEITLDELLGEGSNNAPVPELAVAEDLLFGDTHEMLTFHELPAPVPTEDLGRYSNVVALPVREMASGSVGDVHSSAKGSGARFNGGKIPVDLIPLRMIGELFMRGGQDLSGPEIDVALALIYLGEYQARTRGVEALYEALDVLGDPVEVVRECAQVFDYGRKKYAAWNWSKGMAWSIPFGCAGRHSVFGVLAGEHLDPESGYPHRGHIACNITMLIAYAECYPEGDDRPAAGLIGATPSMVMDEALRA